jgi:D-threo-aldose 1-dehydrogenase
VDIVVGGPYSSGILAGGTHFEYQKASPEIIARVERIKAVAERHGRSASRRLRCSSRWPIRRWLR